jgi:methylated-DNA-protein-cysteine methyltransferase-like protein
VHPVRLQIYRTVQRVPYGRIATYGQIAALAGLPGQARQVGYALNATPEELLIPWHRIINAKGSISKRAEPVYETIQRELLEQEGVIFDRHGRIPLHRYQWQPDPEI